MHHIYRRTSNSMGGGDFKFPCAYPQIWRVRVDSGIFVRAQLWTTTHGTISRFHNSLANFWLSLTLVFFRAVTSAVYHSCRYKPQSRTIMWPRESLPSTVNLFGGQSGRLKAFQAFQATIGFSVGRLYFGSWILKAPQAFHETIGFIV